MKDVIKIIVFILFLHSCNSGEKKQVLYKGELVEGATITENDTVLNGEIKFFDTLTHHLIRIEDYKNYVLNGLSVSYFANGSVSNRTTYFDGKENGSEVTYDSLGQLSQKRHFFHGVQFGPMISYSDDRLDVYSFYSFDGKQLIYFEYDSLINKKESWWHQDFFFYNRSYAKKYVDTEEMFLTYFIYLPSPPAYDFKYSLCKIDSLNKAIETIEVFDVNKVWDTFELPINESQKNEHFKLKLEINRHNKTIWTDFEQLD